MDASKDVPGGPTKDEPKAVVEETAARATASASASAAPTPAGQESKSETATAPVEAAPAAAMPTETNPLETTSVKAESVKPAEAGPVDTAPAEAESIKPIETKAAEKESTEQPTKAVETAPAEADSVKPAEGKSTEDASTKAEAADSKAAETAAIEKPSSEAQVSKAESAKAKSDEPEVESKSTEKEVIETKIVKTEVIEVKVESKVVETAPAVSKPVESTAPDSKPDEPKPPAPAPVEAKPVEIEEEEFSDPDEDDLDDLDDMLDDFSTVKLDSQKAPAAPVPPKAEAPKGAPSGKQPEAEDMFSEEEFAKQLQAGMADLLGELEKSPDMQAQFEDIFKQIAAAEGSGEPATPSPGAKPAPEASAEDESFQDTIRRTMERMQASGDQATAAAASGGGDDFMSEMLKQLSSGDLGALGGEGSEEEFSKMLMGMMEQLTNKEILYEPMKELDEKFPEWLSKNRSTTSQEDLKRYEEQQAVVREIVAKFEEKTYSDSNAADREFIVDRMQKMQAAGSPPADLVGDMPSAQEALNPGDEACNPQ